MHGTTNLKFTITIFCRLGTGFLSLTLLQLICVCSEKNNISEVRLHVLSNMMINKTGTVRITKYLGAFVQLLLLWKSNNYYIV